MSFSSCAVDRRIWSRCPATPGVLSQTLQFNCNPMPSWQHSPPSLHLRHPSGAVPSLRICAEQHRSSEALARQPPASHAHDVGQCAAPMPHGLSQRSAAVNAAHNSPS